MTHDNIGLCNHCRERVPAEFFARDGAAWIRKTCPTCGVTESLVSGDHDAWQAKRDLLDYVPMKAEVCSLHCDRCNYDHKPNIVFVDVTNRCNMNCPICIATIKGMGFDFNPPLEYFDNLFREIARIQPNPVVLLFGGEPTVREDLLDVIRTAKKHGLRPHVVTNGIRLADEEYCRTLCEAYVPFRFSFDGRSVDIYEKMRHNGTAYEKKMKALENLIRFSRRRHTIIATAGRGINDQYLADFFQYIHENRDLIADVGIIPLTENWHPGTFDAGIHTTMEDVEKMVWASIPGEDVEFIPAGISYALRQMRSFFRPNHPRSEVLLLAGAHPNCESMTLLISDGKRYRGINYYLRKSFAQTTVEFAAEADRLKGKLDTLDNRKFFQRIRGQWAILRGMIPWTLRHIRLLRLLGNPITGLCRVFTGRTARVGGSKATRRRARRVLRVAILPFEEEHSIDAARLEKCKGVFAYEDTQRGEVRQIPACLWYPYRNDFLKKLSEKYGVVHYRGPEKTPVTIPTAQGTTKQPSEACS